MQITKSVWRTEQHTLQHHLNAAVSFGTQVWDEKIDHFHVSTLLPGRQQLYLRASRLKIVDLHPKENEISFTCFWILLFYTEILQLDR